MSLQVFSFLSLNGISFNISVNFDCDPVCENGLECTGDDECTCNGVKCPITQHCVADTCGKCQCKLHAIHIAMSFNALLCPIITLDSYW